MAKVIDPIVHKLLRDIAELTSRQFVYEDPWHGYVPTDGALTKWQTGPPVRFADLHRRDRADVLDLIGWRFCREKGLDWRDQEAIRDNVVEGKPRYKWLEGTSYLEPALGDGITGTRQELQARKFDSFAADPGKSWNAAFGSAISWEQATVENKVGFLAAYAAIYRVPFERFAQAVEAALGRPGPVAGETWTLRGQYEAAWMWLGPDVPPADGYEQILNHSTDGTANTPGKGRDDPGIER